MKAKQTRTWKKFHAKQIFTLFLALFFIGNTAIAGDEKVDCEKEYDLCMSKAEQDKLEAENKALQEYIDCTDPKPVCREALIEAKAAFDSLHDIAKNKCKEDSAACVKKPKQGTLGSSPFGSDRLWGLFGPQEDFDICIAKASIEANEKRIEIEIAYRVCRNDPQKTKAGCDGDRERRKDAVKTALAAALEDCFGQKSKSSRKLNSFNKDKLKFNLYPNPSTGSITLTSEDMLEVKVVDIRGQLVETRSNDDLKNSLELTLEKSGVYFIEAISTTGEKTTQKVVVH